MRSFPKRGKILFLFLLLVARMPAQSLYFRNIGTDQGLPSSETYQLLQDHNGYIWIATDGGVCRYDGTNVTSFGTADGLNENVVLGMYEDPAGRIWFRGLSGGLYYYEGGKINPIAANDELRNMLKRAFITSLFVGEGDTLFCGASMVGSLIKIPPADGYKTIIRQTYPQAQVFILENKKRKTDLICGMGNRSSHVDTATFFCFGKTAQVPLTNIQKNVDNACRVMRDRAGKIWFSNFQQLICFGPELQINSSVYTHAIIRVYEDRDGDLWVGTKTSGVFCYKNGRLDRPPLQFLNGLSVSDILQDREGAIWLCTIEKGVFQSLNKNIYLLDVNNEKVVSFCKTSGNLHITFAEHDEWIVDSSGAIRRNERIRTLLPAGNEIINLSEKDGMFFYACSDGFFRYDGEHPVKDIPLASSPLSFIRQQLMLRRDSVIIFSYSRGISVAGDKATPLFYVPAVVNATGYWNGNWLFGTRGNIGLFVLTKDSFAQFLPGVRELQTRVNCITTDKPGRLWVGTNEKGLLCYDNGKVIAYTEQDGIPSNKINAMDFDEAGNLWLATSKGIAKISCGTTTGKAPVEGFGKSHGLPNSEMEKLVCFHGKIWCATKEDVFYFAAETMKKNTVPPPVLIQSVSVNAKPQSTGSAAGFDHDENNLSFTLNGMTFRRWNAEEFIYKLDGYDVQWQHSFNGNVQYTNLPPGAYTFMAYALNNDGVRSLTPARWSFVIRKPFWSTAWFISLVVLLSLLLVYGLARWWVRQVRKREQEKTKMNKLLAEFQLTALRAQMNPHFIFNAISSIQHYILQNEVQQSYNYLAKFSKLIRNVLDYSSEDEILIANEIETLELYIELEQLRFREPFTFLLDVDPELDIKSLYIPTMLVQPFIENAIWHGLMPRKTPGTLKLSFRKKDQQLVVIIEDNGVGRKLAAGEKSSHRPKGLSIIHQRIDVLNVKLDRQHEVTITDLSDHEGNPAGTRVELLIPVLHD